MNRESLRLLNILKTNEELKKKIEELRFGCYVIGKLEDLGYDPNGGNGLGYGGQDHFALCKIIEDRDSSNHLDIIRVGNEYIKVDIDEQGDKEIVELDSSEDWKDYDIDIDEIIGQATFIDLLYFLNGDFGVDNNHIFKYMTNIGEKFKVDIDGTKELLEQNETVLKELNDWLYKEFNIN